MYLHLGADCTVKSSEIIAIFDLRHPQSTVYVDYIKNNKCKYKIVDASCGEERSSCVLTDNTMYLSAISSITLKKRASAGFTSEAFYTKNAIL